MPKAVLAQNTEGPNAAEVLTRGEAVHKIVVSLDLENKQKNFIKDCLVHLPECFFAFSARSDYNGINFSPLILFPDVFPAYKYYRDVNLASMLGIVQGYLNFEQSPFRPVDPVTRVQALKMILTGADLVPWKEKFELEAADTQPKLVAAIDEFRADERWWYARYLNFALDAGIISEQDFTSPDQLLSSSQMDEMIARVQAYINKLGVKENAERT